MHLPEFDLTTGTIQRGYVQRKPDPWLTAGPAKVNGFHLDGTLRVHELYLKDILEDTAWLSKIDVLFVINSFPSIFETEIMYL